MQTPVAGRHLDVTGWRSSREVTRRPQQKDAKGKGGKSQDAPGIGRQAGQKAQRILDTRRGQRKGQPLDDQHQTDGGQNQGHCAGGGTVSPDSEFR